MSKPQLTDEDVVRLADMAKIEVTADEVQNYKKDINNILGHLAMVNDAILGDTNHIGVGESFFNYTREDEMSAREFSSDIIFSNIPQKSKDNEVKVSKVIKK